MCLFKLPPEFAVSGRNEKSACCIAYAFRGHKCSFLLDMRHWYFNAFFSVAVCKVTEIWPTSRPARCLERAHTRDRRIMTRPGRAAAVTAGPAHRGELPWRECGLTSAQRLKPGCNFSAIMGLLTIGNLAEL